MTEELLSVPGPEQASAPDSKPWSIGGTLRNPDLTIHRAMIDSEIRELAARLDSMAAAARRHP